MTIGYMIAKILNTFGKCLKRRKDIWVFGAWSGQNYSDNPKYLFEYVNNNNKEITAVWLTRSKSVVKEIRALGYKCYTYNSLRGMYFALFAGAAFETAGNEDISPLINNELTKTFMLWHGVGGKSSKWKGKPFGETFVKFKDDYLPASSELYIDIMAEAKNLPRDRFRITGQARNDSFITKPKFEYMEELMKKYAGKRFVIYMPTHRNFGQHGNDFINDEEFKRINDFFVQNDIILVYKPHFHELQYFLTLDLEYSNIIFAKEDYWVDPYSYLHYFDLMISDYSSCMYDFILSGKPVVLFTYDIESYVNSDAGLHESFWKYPIGPMCKNWDDVCTNIINLLKNDTWELERNVSCSVYNAYNDGKNCERIVDWVKSFFAGIRGDCSEENRNSII